MDITEKRRKNLNSILDELEASGIDSVVKYFAEKMDRDQDYVSQIKGGHKSIGSKIARIIEIAAGKDKWWLDENHDETTSEMTTNCRFHKKCKDVNIFDCLLVDQIKNWLLNQDVTPYKQITVVDINIKELQQNVFAFEVIGNSMTDYSGGKKSLSSGDWAIIDPNFKDFKLGDLVLVEFGENDYRFRQYQLDGKEIFLKTFDPQIPTIKLNEDIKIVGKVIWRQPPGEAF